MTELLVNHAGGLDEAMISQVREVASGFAPGCAQADRDGKQPLAHMEALASVGLLRGLVPAEFGGGGLSCESMVRAQAEIGAGDPSTGVALNMHLILVQYLGVFMSIMPLPKLEEMFAEMVGEGATLCGTLSLPSAESDTRKAGYEFVQDGDGFVLNGRSGFATNSDAARYIMCFGHLAGVEERTLCIAFVRKGTPGLDVLGNWNAMGLRGTASHDVTATDVRLGADEVIVVPAAAFIELLDNMPTEIVQSQTIGMATIMGVWMGLCRSTLDYLVTYCEKRYGFVTVKANQEPERHRSQEPWARHRLGHMNYMLKTGESLLTEFARQLDDPRSTTDGIRETFAVTLVHWKLTLDEFITGAMRVAGAHGLVTATPLERMIRDLIGCSVILWKTDDLPRVLASPLFGERVDLPTLGGT